jgi:hypothetical protein
MDLWDSLAHIRASIVFKRTKHDGFLDTLQIVPTVESGNAETLR